ncbi:leucine-rich repeat-containing protein 69-like [Nylanderia fulva]|uniref:leucine-rich repeat-containing protein 69-like n=1 Tax=Nylanderia fulva TaxID=613905 RepID=UPI0010FB6A2A|nr:leucine-rich repeat-containing protein 69-like [Nylanderia fulva]
MSLYIKKINLKKERTSSAIEERNINVENMSMAAFLNENFHHTTSLNFLNPICTKNIRNLTLSNINISCLPIELGRLPFLQSVNLSHNELAQSKWTWLEQDTIKKNLIELDISDNSLTELPPQIGKLNTLTYLKACFNKLRYLPQSIGILQNLKHIYLSHNKLEILPGTLKFLGLMCLDISENLLKRDYFFQNNFDFEIDNALGFKKWKIPTLMELSAKIILGFRIPYNNINLISSTLIKYLDEAKYCCICKKPALMSTHTLIQTLIIIY